MCGRYFGLDLRSGSKEDLIESSTRNEEIRRGGTHSNKKQEEAQRNPHCVVVGLDNHCVCGGEKNAKKLLLQIVIL